MLVIVIAPKVTIEISEGEKLFPRGNTFTYRNNFIAYLKCRNSGPRQSYKTKTVRQTLERVKFVIELAPTGI